MSDRLLALGVAVVVVVLDQLTKAWAFESLAERTVVLIDGFLELTLVLNPGGAFSSFQNSGAFLGIAALVVAFVILYLVGNVRRRSDVIALGLILGGAVGNLTDRIARGDGILDGEVVDWIAWWWIPTFNVADASIFCGVVVLLFGAFFLKQPTDEEVAAPDNTSAPDD